MIHITFGFISRLRISASVLALAAIVSQAPAFAQVSPSGFTTGYRYDSGGGLTGTISPDPDGAGPVHYAAVRNTYDSVGRLITIESGELSTWQSENVAPSLWGTAQDPEGGTFAVFKTVNISYDTSNRKIRDTVTGSNGAVSLVTDYSYDALGRLLCTAVRMNSAVWATVTDACTAQTAGSGGADRITKNIYDAAGRLLQVRKGVGTSVNVAQVTYSYTPNGKKDYVLDADGNRARLVYDGLDRQTQWIFPSTTRASGYNDSSQSTALATANSLNGADYEQYGYDNDGNRTSLRKRDATTITYSYDALDRLTSKVVPTSATGAAGYTVNSTYDLLGHQLTATFASGGLGITNAYNSFGELTSASSNLDRTARALSYQYDSDSDRTRITYPDSVYFTTGYDGLDRPSIAWWTTTGGTTQFMALNYDSAGRRSSINRGSSWTFYGYDGIDRLTSECQRFAGGTCGVTQANTLNQTLAYNPASDITSDARDNGDYSWTGAYNVNRNYTTNGLNQYTAAGSAAFTHDANGNLTSDGTNTYVYDAENRLTSATGSGVTATLSYDPLGRLWRVVKGSSDTRFLYDGNHVAAEYNASGGMTKRYFFGPGADEPVLEDTGSALNCSGTKFLHNDHEGSIIAQADCSGNRTIVNTYDEYGIPGSSNTGRFQYTGQAWLPEIGMYYYKARIYSPTLGRFLQTDPIGYKDQVNLYEYAGDDPVDDGDPDGLCTKAADATKTTRPTQICHAVTSLRVSAKAIEFIQNSEGRKYKVYPDSGNLPTVGVGHLVTASDKLKMGDSVSDQQINTFYAKDLAKAQNGVETLVGKLPVSQEEFDALTDLYFNVGPNRLSPASSPGLNRAILSGSYEEIGHQIRYTRDASGRSPTGLIIRNDRRQDIFLNGDYGP